MQNTLPFDKLNNLTKLELFAAITLMANADNEGLTVDQVSTLCVEQAVSMVNKLNSVESSEAFKRQ